MAQPAGRGNCCAYNGGATRPAGADGSASTSGQGGNDFNIVDPFSDPQHPVTIRYEDICAAAYTIKGSIERTPCSKSHMSALTEMEIYFKKDFMLYTGSFKERGALYMMTLLSLEQRQKGLIAASAGNHAQALAYHARNLDIPVTVIMPLSAAIIKIQSCKQFGATIILQGANLGEAKKIAMRLGKEKGMMFVNGSDHPDIVAGQGTMGLEIMEQVPDVDAIIVPIGGGGMLAGICVAVKHLNPKVKIYGVESERCASWVAAQKAGKPVEIKIESIGLADGLAVPKVGVNTFLTAQPLIERVLVVKEEFVAKAILRLVELEKAVIEGAGAAGLAAVLQGLVPELKGKKVVIPLCGGNIDTTILGRCLERGLAADGRLCRFDVIVGDQTDGIAKLMKQISDAKACVKHIAQERAWLKADVFSVQVQCVVETRDEEHCKQVKDMLMANYTYVNSGPHEF